MTMQRPPGTPSKKYRLFSGTALKHLALIAMLLDHMGKALLTDPPRIPGGFVLSTVFEIPGRLAFPLFCFLLIEGYFHTHDFKRYLRRLLIFALISEIPFNLFTSAAWCEPNAQNILFTLSLALIAIGSVDALRSRISWWPLPAAGIVLAGCLTASFAAADYGSYGILVPFAFYLFHDLPPVDTLTGNAILFKEPWSFPAFGPTILYNGRRGRRLKWLNYWFYPVHLLVLGLLLLWFF
jgi:hypothetical protein